MNPFGNLSINHTSQHVLLMILTNHHGCAWSEKYDDNYDNFGLIQQENDIDIYLSSLIKYLIILWAEGVDVDDAYSSENFICVMLFFTINKFYEYSNLSGYKVNGHKACHIWESNIRSHQIHNGKKYVYLGYQKILRSNHSYRRLQKTSNGEQEFGNALKHLTRDAIYK